MNETQVSIKFKNSVTGQTKLDKYKESLQQIYSFLSSIDVNKSKEVDKIAKNTKQTKDDSKQMAKNFNLAFNVSAIKSFANQFERIVTSSTKFIKQSAEYTENLNLLSVAFRQTGVNVEETTNEAMKFVNTLSQMYGLDESKLIRTTGLFKQMANSLGITNEAGTKLSQTLTQLSIDAASLFNAEEIEDAAKVFQSALASQTKPIRGFTGADITQQTLQVTLDTYGIDEAITDLSYAEKRLVIVASLVDQLDEAIGDFGRTIESPANQMKIFTEQVHRLGRAIGNVLMPVFYKILPYMNAFLMVLVEITNYLATFIGNLFGYNFDDYNPFAGIDDSISNLEEDMASAGEQAKKLKNGLRGFDKLNVISSSKDKDSSSGVGGVDNAYYDLLNQAVDKYNSKLQTTQMLATKIRDNILEWLGFTIQTDEETGKLNLKFEKITSGTVLGGLAVGGIIYSGVSKIYKFLSKIGLLKFGNIGKLSLVALAITQIVSILKNAPKHFKNTINFLKDPSWDNFKKFFETALKSIGIVGELAYKIFEVTDALDWLKQKFDELGITNIIKGFFEIGRTIIDNCVKPIKENLIPAIENIKKTFDEEIKPLIESIKKLWDENIQPYIDKFFEFVDEIFIQTNLLQSLFDGFKTFIINNFIDKISSKFELLVDLVTNKINELNDKIKSIKDTLEGVIEFITGVFSGDWDKAWDGVRQIFEGYWDLMANFIKSPINNMLTFFEYFINKVIKGFNTLKKAINELSIDIPEWLGGGHIGFNLQMTKEISLPRLQKGLDFVPSDYYPAYLDYGERVLTKQENQDYNRGIIRGENAIGGQPINATFVIQVGDKEIAKTVLNDLQNMAKSNGQPIKIG